MTIIISNPNPVSAPKPNAATETAKTAVSANTPASFTTPQPSALPAPQSAANDLKLQSQILAVCIYNKTVEEVNKAAGAEKKGGLQGAIFNKKSVKIGINETGIKTDFNTAPSVSIDPRRYQMPCVGTSRVTANGITNALGLNNIGPLDRPGMYVGGKIAGKEVDAGLAWNPVTASMQVGSKTVKLQTFTTDRDGSSATDQYVILRDPVKNEAVLKSVKNGVVGETVAAGNTITVNSDNSIGIPGKKEKLYPNFAFTPYYRSENIKNGNGGYADFPKDEDQMFIYAGDKFNMSLTVNPKTFQTVFSISKPGQDSLKYSETISPAPKIENGKVTGYFDSIDLKRVDSIDQKRSLGSKGIGNEGLPLIASSTKVYNGSWGPTTLITAQGTKPFNSAVFDTEVSKELEKSIKAINSQDGKGRVTAADGSETIYNDASKFIR